MWACGFRGFSPWSLNIVDKDTERKRKRERGKQGEIEKCEVLGSP